MMTRSTFGFVALVVLSFFAGRGCQHLKSGHYYEIRHETTYDSPVGKVFLRYITDSVGVPFMDPGTFEIIVERGDGDVTVYNGRRVFQESYYAVERVDIDGDTLRWNDGKNRFTLKIETIESSEPPPQ